MRKRERFEECFTLVNNRKGADRRINCLGSFFCVDRAKQLEREERIDACAAVNSIWKVPKEEIKSNMTNW